jgi:nitrogen fixation/metabolism regulation signal transduction histidine kinase
MKSKISSRVEDMLSGQSTLRKQIIFLIGLVSFLGLLLLGLLTGVSADAEFLNKYFVWLYGANIIVGIVLFLVLVFLGITLAIRWKQGYFGTKLIVKLAMIFGLVGVLPGAILYSVSLQFVSRSIESWFDVKTESALEAGLQIGRDSIEKTLSEFANAGDKFVKSIGAPTIAKDEQLSIYCSKLDIDQIHLMDEGGAVLKKWSCKNVEIPTFPLNTELIQQAQKDGQSSTIEDFSYASGKQEYRITAVYKLKNQKDYLRISRLLPNQLGENIHLVQQAYSDYQEKALSRIGLRKMYIGSLTLTMFLALFIAVALALILGRQIAQPLLMLLRGTQAVAQGDLSPKPEINTGDELGLLTRQFNNMTRQLADARKSLQESKDFSESILVNLTAGVCVLDKKFNLLVANSGAKRILERDLTPIINKPLSSIAELAYFEQTIKEAFRVNTVSVGGEDGLNTPAPNSENANDNSWQKQIQLYPTPDNEDLPPMHTLLARGTQLTSGQYIVVFDDITDVIAAQRSVAWGEVARRLAHEIKNPLTPIQLSAERILQKLAGKISADQEDFVERGTNTIINQVQAMKQMVNDFRDFARTPTPTLQELDLNQLTREVLGLYEGSKIQAKLDEACPKIMGDPTQLRQVIHNVLQNAQDACLENGIEQEVEIRTETVNFEESPGKQAQMVRLTVVDNGPGFPPRILSRAFEPYITTKAKGTGLGLAVVKKIVDEHGARIELKNREKDGVIRGAKISILFNKLASK